jgi:hypothetical protein
MTKRIIIIIIIIIGSMARVECGDEGVINKHASG